jgi:hypothetical protein
MKQELESLELLGSGRFPEQSWAIMAIYVERDSEVLACACESLIVLQIEARLPPLVLTLFIREILFPFDTIPLSSPLLPFYFCDSTLDSSRVRRPSPRAGYVDCIHSSILTLKVASFL